MKLNKLTEIGFKNSRANCLYLQIKYFYGVEVNLCIDFDENKSGLVSLDYDHEQGIISVPMPNIKTISQLKTFIKLLSNE